MTQEAGLNSNAGVTKEGQNILFVFRLLFHVSVQGVREKDFGRILAGQDVLCYSLYPSILRASELRRRRQIGKENLEAGVLWL